MDLAPAQLVGLAVAGQSSRLLRCSSPWICTDCRACTETCPQGVQVHGLLQWLRSELSVEGIFEEVPVEVEMVVAWFETFKATAIRAGRAGHWWTFLRYRIAALDLFTNLALGWSWLGSGRLRLRPHLPSFKLRALLRRLSKKRALDEERREEEEGRKAPSEEPSAPEAPESPNGPSDGEGPLSPEEERG